MFAGITFIATKKMGYAAFIMKNISIVTILAVPGVLFIASTNCEM